MWPGASPAPEASEGLAWAPMGHGEGRTLSRPRGPWGSAARGRRHQVARPFIKHFNQKGALEGLQMRNTIKKPLRKEISY